MLPRCACAQDYSAQLGGRGRGGGRGGGRGSEFSNVDERFGSSQEDKGARHEQQVQMQQMHQQNQNQNQEHHAQAQAQHRQLLAMAGANLLPPHQLRAILAQQQAAAT